MPSAVHIVGDRTYWIVPATPVHVRILGDTLRPRDRSEILGLGISVRRALWRAYRNSVLCRVALIDGHVAAMWGLCLNMHPGASLLSNMGVPWLHTSAAIERIPIAFVRHARAEVAAMLALRPKLESYVAAEYVQAVRFIKLLGFTVDDPAPVGIDGSLYSRFHQVRRDDAATMSKVG